MSCCSLWLLKCRRSSLFHTVLRPFADLAGMLLPAFPCLSPMGAYFLFSNDVRGKVKADNPDMKITEIAKTIGEMWGKASDKDKEK